MTQEQEDAAWRALPEEIKKDMRIIFEETHHANKDMYDSGWNDATASLLIKLFGRHNLTATEEEKPRFKVGDIVKVSQDSDWGSETFKAAKECFCNTPSEIVEMKAERATIKSIVNGVSVLIPLKYLMPYTEEQEPKGKPNIHIKDDKSEFKACLGGDPSISMTAPIESDKPKTIHIRTKHGTVTIPTKIEYDDSFWLAYRMELAKEVAVELIRSGRDATFLAESTSLIVDGIVRRLKGGDK